jgi:RNA polymerase sigma factor (sigma-70 family)
MTYKPDLLSIFLYSKQRLSRIVAKIVPGADVEDILQEAYLRVHTLNDKDSIREPVAFVTQIAKNLALDHIKSADFRKSESTDFEVLENLINHDNTHDQTWHEVSWKQELLRFFSAIENLPSKCQEVYILKKIYGYSQKEIADKLGISGSAVEKHIAYGTKKLLYLMPVVQEKRISSVRPSKVVEEELS